MDELDWSTASESSSSFQGVSLGFNDEHDWLITVVTGVTSTSCTGVSLENKGEHSSDWYSEGLTSPTLQCTLRRPLR